MCVQVSPNTSAAALKRDTIVGCIGRLKNVTPPAPAFTEMLTRSLTIAMLEDVLKSQNRTWFDKVSSLIETYQQYISSILVRGHSFRILL